MSLTRVMDSMMASGIVAAMSLSAKSDENHKPRSVKPSPPAEKITRPCLTNNICTKNKNDASFARDEKILTALPLIPAHAPSARLIAAIMEISAWLRVRKHALVSANAKNNFVAGFSL
jgi:hypothetical protein